ncbi:MAG: MG2 domain-containing protein [Phycisphaerae bacterium]
MKQSHGRFAVLAAVLVVVNIAGLAWIRASLLETRLPWLRVASVTPDGPLDEADRIVVTFHEPVVPGSKVGEVAEPSPLTVTPDVGGRWRWTSPERLEFVPARPFPPGREFTLALSPKAADLTGRRPYADFQRRLATSPLRVEGVQVVAMAPDGATLEVRFNQPVVPDDLQHELKVAGGDAPMPFECLSPRPDRALLVRLVPVGADLCLTFGGGLTGEGGTLGLGEPVRLSLALPSPQRLEVVNTRVSTRDFDPEVEVRIAFTRDLDPAQPLPEVQISPPVATRVALTGPTLLLTGPFAPSTTYRITIPEQLVAVGGMALGSARSVSVTIEEPHPAVRIPLSRGVLSPQGAMLLDVETVNVRGLVVTASRVHRNNLGAFLAGNAPTFTSSELPERTFPLDTTPNVVAKGTLDLESLLGGQPGVFRVGVRATDSGWTRDSAIVAVTDLAIHAKRGRDGVLAWVTGIRSGAPAPGVAVSVVSRDNQVIAEAVTDGSGLADLPLASGTARRQAWFIVAEHASDLTYLELGRATDLLDDVDQSGRASPVGYDIHLYGDRGLYQPGEKVQISGIGRDESGAVAAELPLAVRVRRPDGREVASIAVTTDAAGCFHAAYESSVAGHVGRYRFEVGLPGSSEALGGFDALIEPFVTPRIEVALDAPTPGVGKGSLRVAARHLIGIPAAGLRVSVAPRHERVRHIDAAHAGYTFDLPPALPWVPQIREPGGTIESTLDAAGVAAVAWPMPSVAGSWRTTLDASVTEAGGRTVSASRVVEIDTLAQHLGLRVVRNGAEAAPTGIEWLRVAGAKPLAASEDLTFRVVRVETDWRLQEVWGRLTWKSAEHEAPVSQWSRVTAEVQGVEPLKAVSGGRHRLYVTGTSGASAMMEFDAPWSDGEGAAAPRPERVAMTIERDPAPGEAAKATIVSPFAGTMLLSLESDRVHWRSVRAVEAGVTVVEVPLPASVRGGAFLAAAVVRGLDAKADRWMPMSAKGLVRVRVDHRAAVVPVTIDVPPTVNPGRRVEVVVTTPPGLEQGRLHVWGVDDGIVMATSHATLDPASWFFAARRLRVESDDAYRDLLPDYRRPTDWTRIGGDGGDEDDRSSNATLPPSRRRRESAVVWLPARPLEAGGRTSVEMTMPARMTGRLRLFAVVSAGDRYGSASGTMLVTQPLMLEPSVPSVLSPGDAVEVAVRLTNTTSAPLAVTLDVATPDQIAAQASEGPLTLDSNASAVVMRRLQAKTKGEGVLTFKATGTGASGSVEAVAEEPILVRRADAFATRTSVATLRSGEPLAITPDQAFDPSKTLLDVVVAPSPVAHLEPALESLIDYPYGCVEQTTSRMAALLAAGPMLRATQPGRLEVASGMIDAGIARLRAMQTAAGGLSYWPGSSRVHEWGTIHALGVLIEARRAGHDVPDSFIDSLGTAVAGMVRSTRQGALDDATRAMACEVLGRMGKPEPGWVATLEERASSLDAGGRATLAMALLEMGRRERAVRALGTTLPQPRATGSSGAGLSSPVSQVAATLVAVLRVDPGHEWAVPLATRLDSMRRGASWGSTLDDAAAFRALAAFDAGRPPRATYRGAFRGDAGTVPFSHEAAFVQRGLRADRPATLELEPGAAGAEAFVTLTASGPLKRDPERSDQGVIVRRRWMVNGTVVAGPLRVGDLVEVEVTLQSAVADQAHANIAVVDPLPALAEVESPSLATSAAAAKRRTSADRVEFRDDRVVIFATAGAEPSTFRYFLRVIGAGTCSVPSVRAESMYDAGVASFAADGFRLEVTR